jgi:hypothetical protein
VKVNPLRRLRFRIASLAESFRWTPPIQFYKATEGGPGKFYKVHAIHVTTTGNRNKYTEEELKLAARSLAERPLNINHEKELLFPQNKTVDAEFESNNVEAVIYVEDEETNRLYQAGKIKNVSIDAKFRSAEVGQVTVPRGIIFTGLALLTEGVAPGDPLTTIKLWEKKLSESLSESQRQQYLAAVVAELRRRGVKA